ncbi:Putative transcriptional regulatory protein C1F7.11c [Fusarium odoratissimum]|uniref:Putative transcriptional regulatory protein C1F7.11c n=1 Tax=Fusarium oxysporum f. sp. cubense (strain race 4) TaxID=2502994 RepID=N1REV5_FUSC4|nr:Putative transcriptional regulatory protein C1F7.11c [Fusarium odoratissimum]
MSWLTKVAVGVSQGIGQNPRTRSADKVMIHGKQLKSAAACDGLRPCKCCRKRRVDCEYRSRTDSVSSSESPRSSSRQSAYRERSNPPELSAFVGRSTAHSFMHHIRNTIEKHDGPSEFTADSNWSGLPERLPVTPRMQSFLPPSTTTSLIEFYSNHVRSFIDIVNPEAVSLTLYRFQNNPNEVQGPDRCIFYLVLAVALALDPGDSAHSPSPEFKHQLFAIAEGLAHPTRTFEKSQYHDDVLWPLQALALMSFFLLSVSMRNTAYEYCGKSHHICMQTNEANKGSGRAVRVAYALGIHRGHESEINQFPANEELRVLRRNVWRSLFVLDRFLAASLGRPFAISDNEYSESSLRPPNRPSSPNKVSKRDMLDPPIDAYGIETQINRLSERCVSQSLQTVEMVKRGFHANLLCRSDPLALYVLFEAALVLLSSTYADIYAREEHLSLVKDAMFILKTWYASSPYAEQFASKLDLFRHEVERQKQVKAIRQASRRQAHKVEREPMTTYEPSQYRSPFHPMPRDSLVSPRDSRRGSATANHAMVKQEADGY